ncbi:MAG: autotransporter outer membrane beta-barrel domain-containing protein [Spirochaetaceae bacterium]|nr:autotransporter outer membrane beta-barrel domain-containing protein [Spirochaetaceae bacterium]
MKKILSIFAFFLFLSSALGALEIPLSIGLGGNMGFGYSSISADHYSGLSGKQSYSSFLYGLFTFFDARYVEVGLGFSGLANGVTHSENFSNDTGADPEDVSLGGSAVYLSLYGKYPFRLGDSFTVYPLMGMEGEIVSSMRYSKDSPAGYNARKAGDSYQGNADDWSAFWFRFGAGVDFYVREGLFLRGELTFGIKANTSREKAIVNKITSISDYKNVSSYGLGGKLTVSVGYTFRTLGDGGGSLFTGVGSDLDVYYPKQ